MSDRAKNPPSLAAIEAELHTLPLYEGANFVPGEGNPEADIFFVGEAPGKKEDELGRPFVGAAGKFLDEMLSIIGMDRSDIFITNIVKQRPPGNRDPLPEEIEKHWPLLMDQIESINPKIIVMLGRHSMSKLLPNVGTISQIHGQPFRRKDGRVYLPLFHPAVALYDDSKRETLIHDFKKIPLIIKKLSEE